jgi:capsular polysaccharide export protein
MFPELEIVYIERSWEKSIEERLSLLKAESPNLAVLLWGYFQPRGFMDIVARLGLDVLRFEDGFLRSVGIGAERDVWGNVNYPVSITLDSRGIYYDRRQTSDAEEILSRYPFERDPVLLDRASACIEAISRHGLTKYNVTERKPITEVLPPRNSSGGRRRVLVIGQVENDASIRYGCTRPAMATNNDLVRAAARENPDAEILYKPHPVVLRGAAGLASDPAHVAGLCRILHEEVNLPDLLDHVDHVYVITSGVGMEALIKGLPVTTFGTNIYAGWGLTDDRDPLPRRTRSLSVPEVFAGFYLLHTRYFDHSEGNAMELEGALDHLVRERGRQRGVEQATRGMQALARGEAGIARELLERAVASNPTILPWWQELGRAAELSGDLERAVDCADRILARCPTSSRSHLIRARLGSRLGISLEDIDRDLAHACRFAEAEDPVPSLEALAHAYLSGGNWLPLVLAATVRAEDAVERAPEAVLVAACALVDADRVDRAVALTSLVTAKHDGVHLPLRLRALRQRAGDLTGPDEWAVELLDVLEDTLSDMLPCSGEHDRLMVVDDGSLGELSHEEISRSVYIGDRRLGSPPLVQVTSRPLRANARTVVLSEDLIDRPLAGWRGLYHAVGAGCEARLVARELTRDLARRIGYWPGATLLFAEWLAQGAGDLGRFDFSRVAPTPRPRSGSARALAEQERLAELTGISIDRERHAGQVA